LDIEENITIGQNKLKESIENGLATYPRLIALRVLISKLIPFGSYADIVISGISSKIAARRFSVFKKALENEIKLLDQEKIDKTYLESEEFYDLLRKTLTATEKTREDEKIHLYAKILVGAIEYQDRNENYPEEYLGILENRDL